MGEKKLSLAGGRLKLGSIDASQLRGAPSLGDDRISRRTVQVEVRRNRQPAAPERSDGIEYRDVAPTSADRNKVILYGAGDPFPYDVKEAQEKQDITAGVSWPLVLHLENDKSFVRSMCIKRTQLFEWMRGIKTKIHRGATSTLLARDLNGYLHNNPTEKESRIYRLAFPNYDDKNMTTMCSPLGAVITLNFLGVYGLEPYFDGPTNLGRLVNFTESLARIKLEPTQKKSPPPKNNISRDERRKRDESVDRALFRDRLLDATDCEAMCPFTLIADPRFLIASHIKPFASCDLRAEKTDPHNGFLLSPNADKLFDCGYISFDHEGKLMKSEKSGVSDELLLSMGLKADVTVPIKSDRTLNFLAFHRQYVFEGPRTKEKSNG